MTKRLTDTGLRALKPQAKQYQVLDASVAGFGVRVSPKGKKTFVLFTRFPGSTSPTARSIGEYGVTHTLEEARKVADDWRKLIKRGIDPQAHEEEQRRHAQRKRDTTFAAVASVYFEHIAERRSADDTVSTLERRFVARWRDRPFDSITRDDVRAAILDITKRGQLAAAHKAFAYLRAMFNWAIDSGGYDLEHSPCDRIKAARLISVKQPRQRVLTDDELFAVWRNASRLGYPFGPMFKLLLLTGARRNEIARMRWRELDQKLVRALRNEEQVCQSTKLLTIPPERFKSNASHLVPLSDEALSIIAALPYGTEGDYVFSTTFGRRPVSGFGKAKARLERRVTRTLRALARKRGEHVEVESFVIHDLRRTMRTRLSALRVPTEVAEMVIGHGKRGLARVYDQHRYLDEMRDALERWAAMLRGIVEPTPSNVVRLTHERVTADG